MTCSFLRSAGLIGMGLALILGDAACSAVPGVDSLQAAGQVYERDISHGLADKAPVRGEWGPLALHVDGDQVACSTCHDGFQGDLGEAALKDQHSNLVFDHGSNSRCLNCHNAKNSDTYVDYAGNEIPGDQPTRLCAKCHGPHYREWNIGVHGRINGYWNASLGPQKKLDCIQCHDPHRPAFQDIKPLPPPVLTRFDRPSHGEK